MIQNPVLRGFNPDPSILRVGDDYYIATSTFEWFPGVQIHHSKDLVNWRLLTRPLTKTSQLDMLGNPDSGGVWAPALSHDGEQFHLIYTDVKTWATGHRFKDTHNYLVTASDIEGPWSDPIYMNSSGFDPSLFHDEDGRKWFVNMLHEHRKGRSSFAGIVLQEYSPKEKKLVGPVTNIFRGTDIGLVEGPHLYKKDGWYYLLTAEGGTMYEHASSIARSKDLGGPYEVHPHNPLVTSDGQPELYIQKAGHGSLVETQNGDWYLAHLCGRPLTELGACNLGRETALQEVSWHDGWPWLEGQGGGEHPNNPKREVPAPDLPAHPFDAEPETDNFDGGTLSVHWQSLRAPMDESWLSLTDRPSFLRLYGRESLASRFKQSLVGRRLQAHHALGETCLEFEPDTPQQMAGLAAFYQTDNWVYLRVSRDEELGKTLTILSYDNREYDEPLDKEVPIGDAERVFMRVIFAGETFHFEYGVKPNDWTRIGPDFEANMLADETTRGLSFTGTFIALCVQDLSGLKKHADFAYFRYVEEG